MSRATGRAQDVRLDVAEAGAVGGEDLRVGAAVGGLQGVDVGRVGGDVEDPEPGAGDADAGEREHHDEAEHDLLSHRAALRAPVPSALASGHGEPQRVMGSFYVLARTPASRSARCARSRRAASSPAARVPPGRRGPWTSIRTPSGVISATSTCDGSSRASASRARAEVGVGRDPDRGHHRRAEVPGRAVDDHVGDHGLVGDDHQPPVARVDERVREGEVVDPAGLVLDRDRVADPDRLRDREQDPGERVGEDLLGGEAEHQSRPRRSRRAPRWRACRASGTGSGRSRSRR